MKKQVLSLMACTAIFAINPAFCMINEENPTRLTPPQKRDHSDETEVFTEIEKTINLNVFHVALLGEAHEPINKGFSLYFKTHEDGAFFPADLNFKPRSKDNGLWEAQIRGLAIKSKEMLCQPQKLEFFIKDGRNVVKKGNEYHQPYSDNLYKVQCMNYKREYTLAFREITNDSFFDITIMDYDIPTFPFQCFLEQKQETPFQILPHQAIRYLQALPSGEENDSWFSYATKMFEEMPRGAGLPFWWYNGKFDKFEKLVDPPVYHTRYKQLTPLQRIEALEDQQLKAQRKVKCGKAFFDFRYLKNISQEEFNAYLNLDFLYLKRILPQITNASHQGKEIPEIAKHFRVPELCVSHILGHNPRGDEVAAISYTSTADEAPHMDEIPQIMAAFQTGKGIPEIARIFRVAESEVARVLEQPRQ